MSVLGHLPKEDTPHPSQLTPSHKRAITREPLDLARREISKCWEGLRTGNEVFAIIRPHPSQ